MSEPDRPTPRGAAGTPSEADAAAPSEAKDVVIACGPTPDGEGASIVRIRDDRVETGELRAAREGQPVLGELVQLKPRPEHARLFDVEVLARGPAASASQRATPAPRKGPSLVNSDAYRDGWESVFGGRRGGGPPS